MGWKAKALSLVLGLLFFGTGAWLLGIICFLYLAISVRPRSAKAPQPAGLSPRFPARYLLAALLMLLSGLALASGGTLSPLVLLGSGVVVLLWPFLGRVFSFGRVVPVPGSILLRSAYNPFAWHALAEVKPGAESFPRAASSFEGTLLVYTDRGRVYSLASCLALDRREAERNLLQHFRSTSPKGRQGAYLLPLDSEGAADVLRIGLSRTKLDLEELAESASTVSGVLVLTCGREVVREASAYEIESPARSPSVPSGGARLQSPPLTWEVLDSVGKRTAWPEPDRFSNLLDSMAATKGAPLSERMAELEAEAGQLTVTSLSGDEVKVTRAQLRAVVSVYS
jgi:hypothetical protein